MANLFTKHNRFISILVILILILVLANLVGNVLPDGDWGESLVIEFVSPFLAGVNIINDKVTDTFNVIFNYRQVKQENTSLRKEVKKLSWKVQQLNEIAKENSRLRKLLNFKEREDFEIVGAKVIGKSASNWSRIVTINRGSEAGLEPKMLAVTYNGYLIGRIEKVTANNAQILLLNDPNFAIGGLISKNESREIGIVNGTLSQTELLEMNKLPWNAEVKAGNKVVTSGLSKIYPKGILIGKVKKLKPENYGLTRVAIIKPFVDLKTFEEVLVITDF
ncbi:rod shape-determining protein MreC [Selenihalanaerobacter shriftii]|uniref:Cell shape-determining protein MreC n=1 Tax=Selenihalanaerobacter shriftii TaxID=142842 RepID=A0A1T4PMY2_9FIRM|nr:rod shape-determining protein MreC [Selenihalanaerobacter shriftii]SJZ92910.1 rod shape-determining protein MreC [Selenihalanaerobacter shriftii]